MENEKDDFQWQQDHQDLCQRSDIVLLWRCMSLDTVDIEKRLLHFLFCSLRVIWTLWKFTVLLTYCKHACELLSKTFHSKGYIHNPASCEHWYFQYHQSSLELSLKSKSYLTSPNTRKTHWLSSTTPHLPPIRPLEQTRWVRGRVAHSSLGIAEVLVVTAESVGWFGQAEGTQRPGRRWHSPSRGNFGGTRLRLSHLDFQMKGVFKG